MDVVPLLLEYGADVDARDDERSPSHLASGGHDGGHVDVSGVPLEHRAEWETWDSFDSPQREVAGWPQPDIVILVERGPY